MRPATVMDRNRRFRVLASGSLILGLFTAGCTTPTPPATPAPAPVTSSSEAAAVPLPSGPAADVRTQRGLDHVVIIVEENKPSQLIIGNSEAPFINKLAADNALAVNYQAVTHPSLPNYLALTSGTNAGITDDCSPGGNCTANVPNIADRIAQSGRSWKMYAEDMPAPCTAKSSGKYAVKHNPFMYYPSVTGDQASCASHVVPFSQLDKDLKSASSLPNFVFISPNRCNDMHDCPVSDGDVWLSQQVSALLASPAFTTQSSLLVVTWDEGDDSSNTVSTIFAGPAAKKGYISDKAFSHYSLLLTVESVWGLAPLTDNDRQAPGMSDMLK
jgi:phosphatidylinositol-3-phosphatase